MRERTKIKIKILIVVLLVLAVPAFLFYSMMNRADDKKEIIVDVNTATENRTIPPHECEKIDCKGYGI